MNRVVVVGAGDFGREVAVWLKHDRLFMGSDTLVFIDDNTEAFARHTDLQASLIGSIEAYEPLQGDRVLMGISNPATKKIVDNKLSSRNVQFSTFIHNSVIVAYDATVSNGCIICPNATVASGAFIDRLVTINISSTVGHDAHLGAYSSLMSHVDITGWVSTGECCFFGSHASILPRTFIGSNSKVGAGSVVIRRVAEDSTVMGVPARKIS